MKKVLIIGEKYSDNLGDPIIADCISFAIRRHLPDVDVKTADFSMRTSISIGAQPRSDNSTQSMNVLYRRFKRLIGWFLFRGKKYVCHFKQKVDSSDLVIIGGGQLFLDTELNFPIKLFFLQRALSDKVPSVVYACGVAKSASFLGKVLMRAFAKKIRAESFYVRDAQSVFNAASVLKFKTANPIVDPAFIVSDVFPVKKSDIAAERTVVGINVMDAGTLCRIHRTLSQDMLEVFWHKVISYFISKGFDVVLHTNGAKEDNDFLNEIYANYVSDTRVSLAVPTNSEELCSIISSCDFLVAFRLHAQIIAYSYGIQTIGFAWDSKVRSFSEIIGRENFFLDIDLIRHEMFKEVICESMQTPINVELQNMLKRKVYDSMLSFLN